MTNAGGRPTRKAKESHKTFVQNVYACGRPMKGVEVSRDGDHAVFIVEVDKVKYLFDTNDFQGWKLAAANPSSEDYPNQKNGYPKDGFERYTEKDGYYRPLMMRTHQILDRTKQGSCSAVANAIAKLFKKYSGSKKQKLEKLIDFLMKTSTTTTAKIIEESEK